MCLWKLELTVLIQPGAGWRAGFHRSVKSPEAPKSLAWDTKEPFWRNPMSALELGNFSTLFNPCVIAGYFSVVLGVHGPGKLGGYKMGKANACMNQTLLCCMFCDIHSHIPISHI